MAFTTVILEQLFTIMCIFGPCCAFCTWIVVAHDVHIGFVSLLAKFWETSEIRQWHCTLWNDIGFYFFQFRIKFIRDYSLFIRPEADPILFSYKTPEHIISLREREKEWERPHFIIPSIHLFVPLGRKLKPF